MEYNTKTGNYFSLTTYKALLSEQTLLFSINIIDVLLDIR